MKRYKKKEYKFTLKQITQNLTTVDGEIIPVVDLKGAQCACGECVCMMGFNRMGDDAARGVVTISLCEHHAPEEKNGNNSKR